VDLVLQVATLDRHPCVPLPDMTSSNPAQATVASAPPVPATSDAPASIEKPTAQEGSQGEGEPQQQPEQQQEGEGEGTQGKEGADRGSPAEEGAGKEGEGGEQEQEGGSGSGAGGEAAQQPSSSPAQGSGGVIGKLGAGAFGGSRKFASKNLNQTLVSKPTATSAAKTAASSLPANRVVVLRSAGAVAAPVYGAKPTGAKVTPVAATTTAPVAKALRGEMWTPYCGGAGGKGL
jgi:hypothetical protein